jgi:hypothetical protein
MDFEVVGDIGGIETIATRAGIRERGRFEGPNYDLPRANACKIYSGPCSTRIGLAAIRARICEADGRALAARRRELLLAFHGKRQFCGRFEKPAAWDLVKD